VPTFKALWGVGVAASVAMALMAAVALMTALLAWGPAQASAASVSSQLGSLGSSPAVRSTQAAIDRAFENPAIAKYAATFLAQHRDEMTAFQASLLELGLLFAQPQIRHLLAHPAKHRTAAQERLLVRAFTAAGRNAAFRLLMAKAHELKTSSAALASALSAGGGTSAVAPPKTGIAVLDTLGSEVAKAVASPQAKTLQAKVHQILSGPRGRAYLKRLPPFVLASLIPVGQIAAESSTRSGQADAHAARLSPELSSVAGVLGWAMWKELVSFDSEEGIKTALHDTSVLLKDLGPEAGFGLGGDALAVIVGEVAPALIELYGGVKAGEEIAELVQEIHDINFPQSIELFPKIAEVAAGESIGYTAIGVGSEGPVGPVSFSLSALPSNICGGHTCSPLTAGTYQVIGHDGAALGFATLKVKPGPLVHLYFTPADQNVTIPPNHSETYILEGEDYWLNPISPIEFGTGPSQAVLSITEGVCYGDTCIPKSSGPHTVTATVGAVSKTTTLTVQAIKITPTALPEAIEKTPYSANLAAEGGEAPYTWAVTAGALPEGVNLDPSTGAISGTPTAAGTSDFEITVTDKNGAKGTAQYSLTVTRDLKITTTSLMGAFESTPYTETLHATGGEEPYTWAVTSGSLPEGLTLGATGVISGTPTESGESTFEVAVTDHAGTTAEARLSLTVTSALSPCGTSGVYSSAGATATCTYTSGGYAGLTDTFTVPAGVSSVDVVAVGASGGTGGDGSSGGGQGASVEDTSVPVADGGVLSVVVGAFGGSGGYTNGGAGGSPGGGGPGGDYPAGNADSSADGGGGGGYSGIFGPSDTPLVIAGGGGGGGSQPNVEGNQDSGEGGQGDTGGGGGQGVASYNDPPYQSGATGGGGGTSGGGGAGGSPGSVDGGTLSGNGTPGSSLTGGQGGASNGGGYSSGGGGGGGYFGGGGGGGGNYGAGGGGGSSYGVGPGLSSQQAASEPASVTISWLHTTPDPGSPTWATGAAALATPASSLSPTSLVRSATPRPREASCPVILSFDWAPGPPRPECRNRARAGVSIIAPTPSLRTRLRRPPHRPADYRSWAIAGGEGGE
jgi:Putative Ig domain